MVEEESQQIASEPAGAAPVNRDKRGDAGVIDGEVASRHEAETAEQAAPEGAEPAAPPSPPPARGERAATRGFLSGALGGAIVSVLAAGGGYYLLAPKADLAQGDANRLAALEAQAEQSQAAAESQAKRENAATANLDKRVGALEGTNSAASLSSIDKRVSALEASNAASGAAGLDMRIGSLEAANAAEAPKIAADAQAVQNLAGEVKDLRADVDAARGEIPGIAARVAKLESGAPPPSAAPDLSAVKDRLDKIEAQLAAPKSETRVAPEKPTASDNPAAVAIIAEALHEKLASGAPFATEFGALESLGVDPAKLAALKPLVNGAPTGPALAASFEALRSKALAAAAPKEEGGIGERLFAHLRGLVQVRNLGETAGDDPAALASQIEADSRRGDISGALAAFAKLPETSRQAASAWAAEASAKQAADAAIQSIREAAVGRLAANAKP